MNEYKQAIWNIRVSKPANKLNAEITILQQLVERATPKKVNYDVDSDEICPNCKSRLHDQWKPKYCEDCGQALDWSDNNDK